jgi:hypothetical protein
MRTSNLRWILLALALTAARPAAAKTTVELRIGTGFGDLLHKVGDPVVAATVVPAAMGIGLRLSPTWRVGLTAEMGLFALSAGAQLDWAPRSFAATGPFVRVGAHAVALTKTCESSCKTLYADEMVFGTGPEAELGAGWRWSYDDDEWGVSLWLSALGAWLKDNHGAGSGAYLGATLGPRVELDW